MFLNDGLIYWGGGEAIQTHLVPLEKVTAPTSIISD